MSQSLALSNSSLASSSYLALSEDEQRKVLEHKREREARSLAVEKAYVHDVYEQISGNFTDSRYRPWPRVKQFLTDLEPGAFVCDVGCGSGKYLSCNPLIYNIGADRCRNLTEIAREKDSEVLICDNMALPYKDDSFDAVLSVAVIHHIATTERRVRAIRELARILRVGGRIIISVWSMEQRHRKFESQDVLIPWHRPGPPSSAEENRDTTTTTCTSEDDVTHYHAYTATSDSEPGDTGGSRLSGRRRGRSRHCGRSISPHGGFPSSSDLSSPNETCYSFVRKAIQKLATNKRQANSAKIPWFLTNLESYYAKEMEAWQLARLNKNDSADSAENGADMPIEIRHLEDSEDMMFIPPLFSSLIGETNLTSGCEDQLNKSKSLNDITGLSLVARPVKLKDAGRSNTCDDPTVPSHPPHLQARAKLLGVKSGRESVENTDCSTGSGGWMNGNLFHRQHPGSTSSLSSAKSSVSAMSTKSECGVDGTRPVSWMGGSVDTTRRNWCSESQLERRDHQAGAGRLQAAGHKPFKALSLNTLLKAFNFPDEAAVAEHHFKELGRELNIQVQEENKSSEAGSEPNKPTQIEIEVTEITMLKNEEKSGKSLIKQVSLNDELFFLQRREERENIKEQIKRQQSLPECHFLSEEKPKTFRDSFLAVTQTKKFDIFLEGITKLRKSSVARTEEQYSPPPPEDPGGQGTSLKVGIAKMLNKWKSESDDEPGQKSFTQKRGVRIDPINVFSLRRDASLDSAATRRGLFHRKGGWSGSPAQLESGPGPENPSLLSPTMRLRCCLECPDDSAHSQERRLSQGGSDSSKDSSIQSDTSLDSEDSCISVIYIAKPGITGSGSGQSQRSTSNSSGSSESPPGEWRLETVNHHTATLTGRASPGSPHTTAQPQVAPTNCETESGKEVEEEAENCGPATNRRLSTPSSPKLPEHKSFEMEDLPDENPINCHPRAYATRVEIDSNPPLSPLPRSDYPIVRHHPLFAKTQRSRSGISSLLVGENVEYMRKPGVSLSKSVQAVRKSSPKLLTFEIFNPETDDLDSDNNESSLSSSPDSEESVISVISDVRNTEQSVKETSESETGQEVNRICKKEENFIFKFDIEHVEHRLTKEEKFPPTDFCLETKSSADSHSQDKSLSDLKSLLEIDEIEKEIERKAEERKKILMSLLDENKSVLQSMKAKGSLTRCDTIEEVKLKTTSQLQSMEELRIPSVTRSQSSSPEVQESGCRSEPILQPLGPGSSQESLKDVEDIELSRCRSSDSKREERKSNISSIEKLKQISGKVQTETEETLLVRDGKPSKVPIEICVTEHSNESVEETSQQSTELVDLPSSNIKDEGQQSRNEESLPTKQKDLNKITKLSEEWKEDKGSESVARPSEITETAVSIPYRKLEKKKRDDSLESTASIKSSVQLSETGSLLSHRFSTISISSNVSSEVSLGNTSGVSGSSCYLASMSSADFDDRPALASSFSLSEAEETEMVASSVSQVADQSSLKSSSSVKKKKDQLSPPRPAGGGGGGDRPKLKSLFKRSSNGNKSGGSGESRSHEGCKEENRSRIGTFSSLSPETSMEQTTCVERSSTSVEEELFRNTAANMEDPFSASDSEDSAETGGSLTHHRYYHVFREGEIDHIIEKYVENLHIISSYYDHANWCIIAEKVNVWTL